ncbi:hypothetical protein Patl1_28309 [Pistacia atlantica]|uniref:Uncharacterized protein n=1 Tax=Pistacia atlantica TaxID=434234 RepID=A0ACC1BDC3_9ROSI|nr:hypothetical protein Patl1_28309 [Pistacia atlantica]
MDKIFTFHMLVIALFLKEIVL